MTYYIALFDGGKFTDIYDFVNQERALGFVEGVEAGSCGCEEGAARAYPVPDEVSESRMITLISEKEIARCRKACLQRNFDMVTAPCLQCKWIGKGDQLRVAVQCDACKIKGERMLADLIAHKSKPKPSND